MTTSQSVRSKTCMYKRMPPTIQLISYTERKWGGGADTSAGESIVYSHVPIKRIDIDVKTALIGVKTGPNKRICLEK